MPYFMKNQRIEHALFDDLLSKTIPFCRKTGIPHSVDDREAMRGSGMVGRALRAWAEGKGRSLAIEVLLVG